MAQGSYDHPSYLTRQQIGLGINTAGANGTSSGRAFNSDMRIRNTTVCVRTAGTSAAGGNAFNLMCLGTYVTGFGTGGGFGTNLTTHTGTNTINSLALGSQTAFSVSTTGDLNFRLMAGSVLFVKNGTDATGVYDVTLEAYLDPEATWTGPNN